MRTLKDSIDEIWNIVQYDPFTSNSQHRLAGSIQYVYDIKLIIESYRRLEEAEKAQDLEIQSLRNEIDRLQDYIDELRLT